MRNSKKKFSSEIKKNKAQDSWAVSYIDMLTLLLCFFVIFYSASSKDKKQKEFEEILMKLNPSELEKNSNSHGSRGKTAGGGAGKTSSAMSELLSDLRDLNGRATRKGTNYILEFDSLSFFDSGSVTLTPAGLETVLKVISKISPHKEILQVKVQGHTDPRPIRNRASMADNWELSVLRATSVLKVFIAKGFSAENLSAEGYADTKSEKNLPDKDLSKYRRITLVILEKKEASL